MVTKKIKIVSSLIIISTSLLVIIYIIKYKNEQGLKNNQMAEDKVIEELKNYHPEINAEQLKFYRTIAVSGDKEISACLGREDERSCVASVAFLKSDKSLCYFHGREHHDDEKSEKDALKKCVGAALKRGVTKEIAKCQSLEGDAFYNCMKEIFATYESTAECGSLGDKEASNICADIFNYQDAYLKYDRSLCAGIKTEKLNQYCLKNIIDKSQDTDGDGLTDLDEINKYGTSYLLPDTDYDGINDFDEVKGKNLNKK